MKKQVVAIVGILAATAIMIYLAALYGNRNRFDYLKDLDKTVFTLDGTDYQLRDKCLLGTAYQWKICTARGKKSRVRQSRP